MLHEFLDCQYGPDGDDRLGRHLDDGAAIDEMHGGEMPLHVAVRRRRLGATMILLERGADIDAVNAWQKTAFAHARRRGFDEISTCLEQRGADTRLSTADRLAIALTSGRLDDAKQIISTHAECVRTGNPEEDRLLADVAGRNATEPVEMLIAAGADLTAPALDSGTPLHQAAWFGQPGNARLLVDAGAPLDAFDDVHGSSPIGWAVHGARYSGGAEDRQDVYVELVKLLRDAGSRLAYPEPNLANQSRGYLERLHRDATHAIRELLPDSV